MERFVHDQNLLHFRAALEKTTDENERKRIKALLDEEEAKNPQFEPPREQFEPRREK